MLLVAVGPSRPLRLPFSLYAYLLICIWEGTFSVVRDMFTASAMSLTSVRSLASVFAFLQKRILLSASVVVLTGPENFAVAGLSCCMMCLVVVVHIHILTFCHTCTGVIDAPATAMLAILWVGHPRKSVILPGKEADVRLVQVVP